MEVQQARHNQTLYQFSRKWFRIKRLAELCRFSAYRTAPEPLCQKQALHRRKIMRKARSKKKRPLLLADLERRYRELPQF